MQRYLEGWGKGGKRNHLGHHILPEIKGFGNYQTQSFHSVNEKLKLRAATRPWGSWVIFLQFHRKYHNTTCEMNLFMPIWFKLGQDSKKQMSLAVQLQVKNNESFRKTVPEDPEVLGHWNTCSNVAVKLVFSGIMKECDLLEKILKTILHVVAFFWGTKSWEGKIIDQRWYYPSISWLNIETGIMS